MFTIGLFDLLFSGPLIKSPRICRTDGEIILIYLSTFAPDVLLARMISSHSCIKYYVKYKFPAILLFSFIYIYGNSICGAILLENVPLYFMNNALCLMVRCSFLLLSSPSEAHMVYISASLFLGAK